MFLDNISSHFFVVFSEDFWCDGARMDGMAKLVAKHWVKGNISKKVVFLTPSLTTFKKMLNKAKQQLREVRASSINEVIGERRGEYFRKSDRVAHTIQLRFLFNRASAKMRLKRVI